MTTQWQVRKGYQVVGRIYTGQFGGFDVVVEGRHDWVSAGNVDNMQAAHTRAAKALQVPQHTLTVVEEN